MGDLHRLPCPHCGSTAREFSRTLRDSCGLSDSLSWSQTRPGPAGSAVLTDHGELDLNVSGCPPRNEEGALAASALLVKKLNDEGGNWTDPEVGEDDVDFVANDRDDNNVLLRMQVVRASNDESMWRKLAEDGIANKHFDTQSAADELFGVIQKKSEKYPVEQKRLLTLVIDAHHTPTHTFNDVHDEFESRYFEACKKFEFAAIWVVGTSLELIARLDV
ncbi:MAG: hypothetical protein KZQ93_05655 [Candidatus Thiodiazotropha sp. (ex Monitilora ramsayi)]|nr:hypothetical protein [Candidatus Thiodiazotropha sp. (ex Monitilora ramsayi)]